MPVTTVAQAVRQLLPRRWRTTASLLALAAQQVVAQTSPAPETATEETLQEVVVTSKILFKENDAFGASKMGVPLIDIPQSVSVVTADVIKFAQMQTFEDYYKVDASSSSSHAVDDFPRNYFRGFRQQGINTIRVDGFRMPGNINLDLALFDRFEVIKGPTSAVYGQNSVSGTLNAVSKVPQNRTGLEVNLEAAEFDTYRADVDFTGAIGGSDLWSYRFIGVYEDSDSFIDFNKDDVRVLSPSVEFRPNDSTKFFLRAIYQKSDIVQHFAPALQLRGNGSGEIFDRVLDEGLQEAQFPRSRFFGMPWNNGSIEARFLQFQAEHSFANDWTLRAHAQGNEVNYRSDAFFVAGPFDQDGFAYFTSVYGQDEEQSLYGAEVNLFGDVELFGREHTLFFGLDYNRLKETDREGRQDISFDFPDSAFNVFAPDYSAVAPFSQDDYAYLQDTDNELQLFGATVQLIAKPTDRVNVLLSARYSRDNVRDLSREGTQPGTPDSINSFAFDVEADETFNEWVFQAGINYEITESTKAYFSYGETFEPGVDRVFLGIDPETQEVLSEVIDPEEGTSYEVGVKSNVNADLSWSFALFELERANIAQENRARPNFSVPLGTQRSRGAEFGLQGKLLPQLSLYLSMAYLDAEFIDGDFAGLPPENAPRFGVSAFGSYEILDGSLQGLGFGLGVIHKRGRETFDENWITEDEQSFTFDFGAFTEVDARVFYERDAWNYALSISNLFDERYYSPTFTELDFGIHVNPPRTARLSVSYSFR
jgi:TonB-dependent siderophore receptor